MSPKPAPTSPLDGAGDRPRRVDDHRDTPASVLAMGQWFETRNGKPVSRPAVCGMCGATFTQHKLTERFLTLARSKPAFPIGAEHAIDRVIPDGWVPLHCPPCEHVALNSPDRPAIRVSAKIDERYLDDERAAMQEAS